MEPVRVWLEGRGLHLAYRRRPGTRIPLVVLHGTAATGAYWERLLGHLPAAWDVLMPDLRGHGQSDKPGDGYGFSEVAGDVLALLDALGIDRIFLAGHSWGGKAAFRLAADHPGVVQHLIAIDPMALAGRDPDPETLAPMLHYFDTFSGPFASLEEAEARVRGLIEAIPSRRWTEQSARTLRRTLVRQPDGTWVGPCPPEVTRAVLRAGLAEDLTPCLGRIRCPVTLAVVRPRAGEFESLRELFPDFHLELFDSSHWIPSDRPEQLAALMVRRLAGPGNA